MSKEFLTPDEPQTLTEIRKRYESNMSGSALTDAICAAYDLGRKVAAESVSSGGARDARDEVEAWFLLPYHDLGFRHEGPCAEKGSKIITGDCVYCRVITAMAAYKSERAASSSPSTAPRWQQDAFILLAALKESVKWELAPEVKAEIGRLVASFPPSPMPTAEELARKMYINQHPYPEQAAKNWDGTGIHLDQDTRWKFQKWAKDALAALSSQGNRSDTRR